MKKNRVTVILLTLILIMAILTSCGGKTEPGSTTDAPTAEQTEAAESINVYVSIADKTPLLTWAEANVTDADSDGALTICDALYCAHEQYFEDGADGFAYEETEYGLSLTKLGGIGDGAAFGYYLNNASPMSLLDEVKDGDSVYAFVYTDSVNFSDVFCYFDENRITPENGKEFTLTLTSAGFDENWAPVTSPLRDAQITVDGENTGIFTDEEGKAAITLTAGEHIISAVSDTVTLVPPVCTAEVKD